eukprot:TRINITY_DN24084_c1_g1_i1.p1 TRINITY_DN24084_c1_g1~~TRINITY_DN24084_c1_g1_i1.p1  ORF type:complete len:300 (+),score=41.48 TRINITY_DN24084_c1_g1_i1:170-1069(+)
MLKTNKTRWETTDSSAFGQVCVIVCFMFVFSMPSRVWLTTRSAHWVNPLGSCTNPAKPNPTFGGSALTAVRADLGSAKLLVFEPGTDVPLWSSWNCKGRNLFLEAKRVSKKRLKSPTSSSIADDATETELMRSFKNRVPREAFAVTWDVIYVSSIAESPHLNIFSASRLAGPDTVIFVDNCQKPTQQAFVKRWLRQEGFSMFDNGHGDVVCRLVGPARVVAGSAAADADAAPEQRHVSSMKKSRKARTNGTSDVRGGDIPVKTPSPVSFVVIMAFLIVYAVSMCQMRQYAMRKSGVSST